MKKYLKTKLFGILFVFTVSLAFFWMVFVKRYIPFPGDLLLTQYGPWRHQSYAGYVAGAIPSKDQYFDVIRELYPWKTIVVNLIKNKQIPLWNPYNFSGAPLLANYQSQVFYPLTFLYYLFPQITAWAIMVILQPVLGSIFMFLFTSEIGLSVGAATLAALLFNFSSFASIWMEFTTVWHTILWLPLLLYLVERGIKQKKFFLWQQLLFIFALFSSITGGHPQDCINTFLFFCIYSVFRIFTTKDWNLQQKFLFLVNPVGILTILSFGLAAPQLLPTIELFKNSARVTHDYSFILSNLIVQVWQLPLLIVQDFYGNPATKSNIFGDYILKTLSIGTVGFSLALTGVLSKKQSWHKVFFIITAAVLLLITVRSPISELFYRFPIPVMSTGTPTRILFLLMLSLSILAAIGYDDIMANKKFPRKPVVILWIIFILLWAIVLKHHVINSVVLTPANISAMKRAMAIATVLLIFFSAIVFAAQRKKILVSLIILIAIGELYYGFVKFNPFVPSLFVFPPNTLISYFQSHTGINRYWGYGTAEIEANFATQTHTFSTDGTDPLNLSWYNKLIQSGGNGHLATSFTRETRSDAKIISGYGENNLPSNPYRLRLFDVLGVKYVIDRAENPKNNGTFPQDTFTPIWHQDDWTVYENTKAAPRYFLTSDVRSYTDDADFEKQFYASTFDPSKTVLLAKNDFEKLPALSSDRESANLVSYTPNGIVFQVTSSTPQLLFISDTYDMGWTASVNGKPSKVYKADYALRATTIPMGKSTVRFDYEPLSFSIGILIMKLSAFFTAFYILVETMINKKYKKHAEK